MAAKYNTQHEKVVQRKCHLLSESTLHNSTERRQ
jgi:hypothetical protein